MNGTSDIVLKRKHAPPAGKGRQYILTAIARMKKKKYKAAMMFKLEWMSYNLSKSNHAVGRIQQSSQHTKFLGNSMW